MSARYRAASGGSDPSRARAGASLTPRARCLRCLLGGAAALAFAGLPVAPAAATVVDTPPATEISSEPAVLVEQPPVFDTAPADATVSAPDSQATPPDEPAPDPSPPPDASPPDAASDAT